MATIGITHANWYLSSRQITAPTAAASVQPRASRYSVPMTANVPTESTCPQTDESKITPGLKR